MEVDLSWEPNVARVDFDIKKFSGKISFQGAIEKLAEENGLVVLNFLNSFFVDSAENNRNG